MILFCRLVRRALLIILISRLMLVIIILSLSNAGFLPEIVIIGAVIIGRSRFFHRLLPLVFTFRLSRLVAGLPGRHTRSRI